MQFSNEKSQYSKLNSIPKQTYDNNLSEDDIIIENCTDDYDYNNSNKRVLERVNTYNDNVYKEYYSKNISPKELKNEEFKFKTVSPINKSLSCNNISGSILNEKNLLSK